MKSLKLTSNPGQLGRELSQESAAVSKLQQSREPPQKFRADTPPPQLPLLLEVLLLFAKIAAICLAFLLLFTFLFGLYRNAGADMTPAVKDGDLVIFYRLDKRYIAGDALVLEFKGKKQVRRVAATAGDTVDITGEGLIINGALQQEPDIYFSTQRYEGGAELPATLGEGQVFVLGDHRTNATDSRIYGVVEVRDTLGKVMAIFRRRGL